MSASAAADDDGSSSGSMPATSTTATGSPRHFCPFYICMMEVPPDSPESLQLDHDILMNRMRLGSRWAATLGLPDTHLGDETDSEFEPDSDANQSDKVPRARHWTATECDFMSKSLFAAPQRRHHRPRQWPVMVIAAYERGYEPQPEDLEFPLLPPNYPPQLREYTVLKLPLTRYYTALWKLQSDPIHSLSTAYLLTFLCSLALIQMRANPFNLPSHEPSLPDLPHPGARDPLVELNLRKPNPTADAEQNARKQEDAGTRDSSKRLLPHLFCPHSVPFIHHVPASRLSLWRARPSDSQLRQTAALYSCAVLQATAIDTSWEIYELAVNQFDSSENYGDTTNNININDDDDDDDDGESSATSTSNVPDDSNGQEKWRKRRRKKEKQEQRDVLYTEYALRLGTEIFETGELVWAAPMRESKQSMLHANDVERTDDAAASAPASEAVVLPTPPPFPPPPMPPTPTATTTPALPPGRPPVDLLLIDEPRNLMRHVIMGIYPLKKVYPGAGKKDHASVNVMLQVDETAPMTDAQRGAVYRVARDGKSHVLKPPRVLNASRIFLSRFPPTAHAVGGLLATPARYSALIDIIER